MTTNLIEQLKLVEDFRTTDGRRHPLWLVLLFVIMETMNGASGYRACGDFVKRHQQELIETFGISRHGVPSYSTIRRVMMGVNIVLHPWGQPQMIATPIQFGNLHRKGTPHLPVQLRVLTIF
ncbi:transposase family protein [Chamaesiphon sp.]|uniref:transposase family protein n=1 Tax=Chamaesiphon sp. TaxID=2814140 RepID=UPI00359480BD